MDIDDKTPLFTIGVVERLTGLSKRQIRYYDKLGMVVPDRTDGNKRRYSLIELKELFFIRDKLVEGKNIRKIKNFLNKNGFEEKPKVDTRVRNRFNEDQDINLYTANYLDVMLDKLTKGEED
ncbi:MAG: MerR family transcriptional regulator [Halanaerobiales bacterium]